jgi:ferredoxin
VSDGRARGACLGHDPDIFSLDGTTKSVLIQREVARAVCTLDCPVRRECLAAAVARREKHGIFGGVNFSNAKERTEALKEA